MAVTIAACAEIVWRGDPDRFLATMAAPVSVRQKLFPLYAMNVEISRAPWVTQEPLIAEIRLHWWWDTLDEIVSGRTVRPHEVTTPLSETITKDQAERLKSVVEARNWDIGREGFADLSALYAHIDRSSGVLTSVAASLLGGCEEAACDLGFAIGAATWLRAVPNLVALSRHPLPDNLIESAKALAQEGLERLASSRRHKISKSTRPLWLTAFDTPLVLKNALTRPESVLTGRITPSEFRRRLRLMRISFLGI